MRMPIQMHEQTAIEISSKPPPTTRPKLKSEPRMVLKTPAKDEGDRNGDDVGSLYGKDSFYTSGRSGSGSGSARGDGGGPRV